MATTNHVQGVNIAPTAGNSYYNCVWKLTRCMKKAGWKYKASGDGSTKDTSSNPSADLWGGGVTTNLGGSLASIDTPTRGRATVTGLTGILSSDKGRFLDISGGATGANNHQHQIEEVLSSTSVRIDARTFAVAADANNGSLTWSIKDPMSDTQPSGLAAAAAWICMEGPHILKIPIASSSTGNFFRGENIVQASSGFEGEIRGYYFNSETAQGYLVVAPRLRGTGSGIFGLTDGQLITGGVSSASVSQSGTALDYVYEVVIFKANNTTTGSMYCGQFDTVNDATDRFSATLRLTDASATVAPGGANSGNNTFPNFAWVVFGTGAAVGHTNWTGHSGFASCGNAQIICVDVIEEQNYSADGSFLIYWWSTATAGGEGKGFCFQICDNGEDGDLAPYITYAPANQNTVLGSASRTAATSNGSLNNVFSTSALGTYTNFRGWRKRGLSGDSSSNFIDFDACILYGCNVAGLVALTSPSDSLKIANNTSSGIVKIREPIWIISSTINKKINKGTLRWMYWIQGGSSLDLFNDKTLIQLSSFSSAIVPMIAGPWSNTLANPTGT